MKVKNLSHRRGVLVVCGLGLAVAGILGAVSASGGSSVGGPETAPSQVAGRITAIDASQKHFGIFRRAQVPGDAIPSTQRGPDGANYELARRVKTAAGDAWIIPAAQEICIRALDAAGPAYGCSPTSAAEAGQLALSIEPGEGQSKDTIVYGLVPDGVTSVTVRAGAATTSVPVSDNVYSATLAGPGEVSYSASGHSGQVHIG